MGLNPTWKSNKATPVNPVVNFTRRGQPLELDLG